MEPTNACNLKCFMCDYQKQFKGARSYLSLKDFESIIAQFPQLEELVFCGIGEPLLNKDITEMISIAVNKKIPFINLITNGSMLTGECLERLIKAGLRRIQISFHSANPAVASKINGMPPEIHDLIRANIINAVKLRRSLGSELCIGLNSVMNIDNYNESLELIDFCEANKIDQVNFLQLTTIFGKYDNFNIRRKEARSLLKKIRGRLKNSRLKAGFLTGNYYGRCYQLWNFIMIHSDGNISPCNGIMPHENKNIGNLINDNINRIWCSEKYIDLRKSVIEKKLENCRHCAEGYLLEGKNFEWIKNYYLKPLIRNLYTYIRK